MEEALSPGPRVTGQRKERLLRVLSQQEGLWPQRDACHGDQDLLASTSRRPHLNTGGLESRPHAGKFQKQEQETLGEVHAPGTAESRSASPQAEAAALTWAGSSSSGWLPPASTGPLIVIPG